MCIRPTRRGHGCGDEGVRVRWTAVATDDDALLESCRRGDRQAWHDLVHRYHRLARAIAISYGLRGDDVDDVVQVVFSVLVKHLDRFHPDTRLAPWLSTVARRHVWRTLENRRRELVSVDAGRNVVHHDVDDQMDRRADSDWLRTGLAQLSPRCRALLEALYLYGERPYTDVAHELGIPIGSIGPTRARCLDHLRRSLTAAPVGATGESS